MIRRQEQLKYLIIRLLWTAEFRSIQTLSLIHIFDDPYTFGQIAAANALSDIYAMGGTVKSALNIVCFPEKMDLNILCSVVCPASRVISDCNAPHEFEL